MRKFQPLHVIVPAKSARPYIEASLLLLAILGRKTPSPADLVNHEVGHRCRKAVATDYLYCIGRLDESAIRILSEGNEALSRAGGSRRAKRGRKVRAAPPRDLTRN
jgi:hypothetical protein